MRTPGFTDLGAFSGFARSLRFKATASVATFLVLISALLSILFVIHVERTERLSFLATMSERSSLLADLVAGPLAEGDRHAVRSVLRAWTQQPGILFVSVQDDEETIASFSAPDYAPSDPEPRKDLRGPRTRWLDGGAVGEVTRPIDRPSDEVAPPSGPQTILRAAFSYGPSQGRVRELRWRTATIAAGMIVLGVFGTMFLVGHIVSPVQELAAATRRVSEGDLTATMRATSGDEIGVLARSFNEMTGKLRTAREEQDRWNHELEARVREKTREIEETRRHLFNIVENVGASILVADLDGTIVSANGHTMEIFGTKPEWAIGLPLDEFVCDAAHSAATTASTLATGVGPIVYEARYQSPRGDLMHLLITHTVLRDVDGEPRGLLQITKDLTQVRGMEERLVESERLSRMGEMAGEIGHELNNYLLAIGGRAELIPMSLDRGNVRKARASAAIIVDQVSEMRKLTDGLLESARKESSPEDFDLNELVRGTVDFVKPQNRYDRIEVVLRLGESPLPVRADPAQIRQVVLNLLSNGAESVNEMRQSGGRIEIETFRDGEGCGLSVKDNGLGIDQETKSRIFEPHFTTKARGHGFGLAVCHRVVTNHDGRITVTSSLGKGATFTVRLPLARRGAPAPPLPVSSDRADRASSSP